MGFSLSVNPGQVQLRQDHRQRPGAGEQDRCRTNRGGHHPSRKRAPACSEHPGVEDLGTSGDPGTGEPVEVAGLKRPLFGTF